MFSKKEKTAHFDGLQFNTEITENQIAFTSQQKSGSAKKSWNPGLFDGEKTEVIFPSPYKQPKRTIVQDQNFAKGQDNDFNIDANKFPINSPLDFSPSRDYSYTEDKKIFNPSLIEDEESSPGQFVPKCREISLISLVDEYLENDLDICKPNSDDFDKFMKRIEVPAVNLPPIDPFALTTQETKEMFNNVMTELTEEIDALNEKNEQTKKEMQENLPNWIVTTNVMTIDEAQSIVGFANKCAEQFQKKGTIEALKRIVKLEREHQKVIQFANELETTIHKNDDFIKKDSVIQIKLKQNEIKKAIERSKEENGDLEEKKDRYVKLHESLMYEVTSLKRGIAKVNIPYSSKTLTLKDDRESVNSLNCKLCKVKRKLDLEHEISKLSAKYPCVASKDIGEGKKIVSVIFTKMERNIRINVNFIIYSDHYPFQRMTAETKDLYGNIPNISATVSKILADQQFSRTPLLDAASTIYNVLCN